METGSVGGLRFDDRVAIVTGAGKGLGRAYARWLAARGARVLVNNRSQPGRASTAEAVVDEIRAAGGIAAANEDAVEIESSGAAMVAQALREFGRLDIVVCNAGVSNARLALEDLSTEALRHLMDVNFYGSVWLVKAALPAMRSAAYGRIVLTTSTTGLYGSKSNPGYGAAKMALVGLGRCLAQDVGGSGIRVNLVAPAARTDMGAVLPERVSELMSAEKLAPIVGWLSSETCDCNGAIFFSGAGRARRVSIAEGPVLGAADAPALAASDLSDIYAPRDLQESVFKLVPELVEGDDRPWGAKP